MDNKNNNNTFPELPTAYQQFIHTSRYARWLPSAQRREQWAETVNRYFEHFFKQAQVHTWQLSEEDVKTLNLIEDGVLALEIMPSMRMLMTAGPALERDNVAGFNCAYTAVDNMRVFDEIMYILMCGTGVGFSVEAQYVEKLSVIPEEIHDSDSVIVVRDSKIGWSVAFKELIVALYSGTAPKWDMSKIRPAGAPLKTFGGRASGPDPLEDLFKFTINTFRRFAGKKLPSIAVHDLVCKIADIVVVGGVRRSALISLSDLNDTIMSTAKSDFKVLEYTLLGHADDGKRKYSIIVDDAPYGERSLLVELDDFESGKLQSDHKLHWYHVHPERALANNSVAYETTPSVGTFMQEWMNLYNSHSGERGIYNREAAINLLPERRKLGYLAFGTNPCSEIILRSGQFCNLTEVVVRQNDTLDDLKRKVRHAATLGTFQATQTNFRYLRSHWKRNTEEEALLGVSITGIMDHPVLSGEQASTPGKWYNVPKGVDIKDFRPPELKQWLQELKEVVIETNKEWAEKLGINSATATTCVKPSGTVSQLVDSASGIHARHASKYIRTVRIDKKDPIYTLLKDRGAPMEDLIGKEDSTAVISFPMEAPPGAITRNDRTAIEQLELWKTYALHWCEHKPSVTISVRENEWLDVQTWVHKNFDILSGISFLPHSDHSYKQAPYQDVDDEEYFEHLKEVWSSITLEGLAEYEKEDHTTATHELACTAGACEII